MPKASHTWLTDLFKFCSFIALVTIAFSWLGLRNSQGLIFELPCYFRVQYIAVLVFYIPLTLVWLNHKLTHLANGTNKPFFSLAMLLASIATLVLNVTLCLPLYQACTVSPNKGRPPLKCLQLNVLSKNTSYDLVAALVKKYDPDVIALEEMTAVWCQELKTRLKDHPYALLKPRPDNFGAAIFSKTPLDKGDSQVYSQAGLPTLLASVEYEAQPVTIVCTHPLAPASQQNFLYQNEQLKNMAQARPGWGKSVVLMGDLNTNSWAQKFNDFLKEADLRDSRTSFGVQASWPYPLPVLLIPLDHCLHSPDLETLHRQVCQPVGSDHYPVYIELQRAEP